MGPLRHYWYVPANLPTAKWQGGELLAWRVWRLVFGVDRELRLASLSRHTVWEGPVLTADHPPIAIPTCASGIYALKPQTRPARGQFNWALGCETWVRGWVALSGQVVEHRYGYRAERVVIRRLRLGPAAHRLIRTPEWLAAAQRELERRYQCPVKITGIDARIARGFMSPVSVSGARTPGAAPTTPARVGPRRRTDRPRGVSPDGIAYDAVRRVFAQAERALGTRWQLAGHGHCERVTLKAHYSRHARLGAPESVAHFSPSGCMGWRWIYPAALVRRAASILKIDPNVLVSRWL